MQVANQKSHRSASRSSSKRHRFALWLAVGVIGSPLGVPLYGQEAPVAESRVQESVETSPVATEPTPPTTPLPELKIPTPKPGDEDFDKAIKLRINVSSLDQLNEVVELTESAIKKGLDPINEEAAKIFLAAAYKQRVELGMRDLMQSRRARSVVSKALGEFLDDLTRSIELDPSQVESYLIKVAILRDRQEFGEAMDVVNGGIQVFEPRLEARGKSLDFREKLAKLYIARASLQDDVGPQVADLEKAVEVNPTDVNTVKQLLGLLESQQISEGVDNTEKILSILNNAMEYAPEVAEFQLAKIGVLLRANRADDAMAYSTECIAQATNDETKSALLRQRSLLQQIAGNKELAKKDLDDSIALAKDNVGTILLRARLSADMKNFEAASKDIQTVLDLDEQNADAILLRADLASIQGDFDSAISDYRSLVARVPNGSPQKEELMTKLSLVYWQSKRNQQALRILDQIIQSNDSNWQAYRLRGEILLSEGEHADAITAYEKALSLLPDSVGGDLQASLMNNLSWVLATSPRDDLRDGTRALELALKACELTEYKQAHILSTLGAAYAEKGEFDKAIEFAKKGVELGKENQSEQLEQLESEVKSYEEKKPWREKQEAPEESAAPALPAPTGPST